MASAEKPPSLKPQTPEELRGQRLMRLVVAIVEANFRIREGGKLLGTVTDSGGASLGLMRNIRDRGTLTVANAARIRAQSRQHVQKLADQLAELGYIEFIDNPEHKRSQLMTITARGDEAFAQMVRKSRLFAASLDLDLTDKELELTIDVLSRVIKSLEFLFAKGGQPPASE